MVDRFDPKGVSLTFQQQWRVHYRMSAELDNYDLQRCIARDCGVKTEG